MWLLLVNSCCCCWVAVWLKIDSCGVFLIPYNGRCFMCVKYQDLNESWGVSPMQSVSPWESQWWSSVLLLKSCAPDEPTYFKTGYSSIYFAIELSFSSVFFFFFIYDRYSHQKSRLLERYQWHIFYFPEIKYFLSVGEDTLLLSETRGCHLFPLVHRIFWCPNTLKRASSVCRELVYYGAKVAESGPLCKSLVLQMAQDKNGERDVGVGSAVLE